MSAETSLLGNIEVATFFARARAKCIITVVMLKVVSFLDWCFTSDTDIVRPMFV